MPALRTWMEAMTTSPNVNPVTSASRRDVSLLPPRLAASWPTREPRAHHDPCGPWLGDKWSSCLTESLTAFLAAPGSGPHI